MGDALVNEELLRSTTDAQVWAQEFMKVVTAGIEIDEGLMIGWFANAIETAKGTVGAEVERLRALIPAALTMEAQGMGLYDEERRSSKEER